MLELAVFIIRQLFSAKFWKNPRGNDDVNFDQKIDLVERHLKMLLGNHTLVVDRISECRVRCDEITGTFLLTYRDDLIPGKSSWLIVTIWFLENLLDLSWRFIFFVSPSILNFLTANQCFPSRLSIATSCSMLATAIPAPTLDRSSCLYFLLHTLPSRTLNTSLFGPSLKKQFDRLEINSMTGNFDWRFWSVICMHWKLVL